MKRHAAPIIAAALLLLPVLYVGSYLALVVPQGIYSVQQISFGSTFVVDHYRWQDAHCQRFYWPLEQIDRKVRPVTWGPQPVVDPN